MTSISICVGSNCRKKSDFDIFKTCSEFSTRNNVSELSLNVKLCHNLCKNGPLMYWESFKFDKINELKSKQILKAISENDVLEIQRLEFIK